MMLTEGLKKTRLLFFGLILMSVCFSHRLEISQATTHTFQSQEECIKSSLSPNKLEIPMINCYNLQYSITIGLGTPPQPLTLQFDTGSNILWVPASPKIQNKTDIIFNCSASSTCTMTKQNHKIEYASQDFVSGNLGYEEVTVAGTDIRVNNTFLLVEEGSIKLSGDTVGIIGMGYTLLLNFLDLAFIDDQIKTNIFILSLKNGPGSVLHYNELPQDILKGTLYGQVASKGGYWQLDLIGMYAGQDDFTQYAQQLAVIDSGTSLFYLNPSLFEAITKKYINPKFCLKSPEGGFNCECFSVQNKMPNLYFMFPGVQINIPSSAYVIRQKLDVCYVMLFTLSTTSSQVLLGDTLFHQYSITFDRIGSRIGFYGDTKEINIFGSSLTAFKTSQYIMMGFSILIFLMSAFLLYHLRIRGLQSKAVKKYLQEGHVPASQKKEGKELGLLENDTSPYAAHPPKGKVLFAGETEYAYQQRMNQNI